MNCDGRTCQVNWVHVCCLSALVMKKGKTAEEDVVAEGHSERVFPALGSAVVTSRSPAAAGVVARIRRVDRKRESPSDDIWILHRDGKTETTHKREAVLPLRDASGVSRYDIEKLLSFAAQFQEDGHRSVCLECGVGGQLILCSECINCAHLRCTAPPLENVPSTHWRCHVCAALPSAVQCARLWLKDLDTLLAAIAQHDVHSLLKVPVSRTFVNVRYTNEITQPMDLGTMQRKARAGCYTALKQVSDDVELMVRNCVTFNAKIDAAIVEYSGNFGVAAHRCVKMQAKQHKDALFRSVSDVVLAWAIHGTTEVPPPPVLWPLSDNMVFEAAIRVSAASPYERATLHYSVDGTEPTVEHPIWPAGGLVISRSTVVNARCFAMPSYNSGVMNGPDADHVGSPTATMAYKFVNDSVTLVAAASAPSPSSKRAPRVAAEKRPRADALPDEPRVWAAFISTIDRVGALSAQERGTYRMVALSRTAHAARTAGVHPFDVERVLNDFAAFRAINADLLGAAI
jgi:hypothetical protein